MTPARLARLGESERRKEVQVWGADGTDGAGGTKSNNPPQGDWMTKLGALFKFPPWYTNAVSTPPKVEGIPESLFFRTWFYAFLWLIIAFVAAGTNFFNIPGIAVTPFCSFTALTPLELLPGNISTLVRLGVLVECDWCNKTGCFPRTQPDGSRLLTEQNIMSCRNAPTQAGCSGQGVEGGGPLPLISLNQLQYGPCAQTWAYFFQGVVIYLALLGLLLFVGALWLWYSEAFQGEYEGQFMVPSNPPPRASSGGSGSGGSGGSSPPPGPPRGGKGGAFPVLQAQPQYQGRTAPCCGLESHSPLWRWCCCWPSRRSLPCWRNTKLRHLLSLTLLLVCFAVVTYIQTQVSLENGITWFISDCPGVRTVFIRNFDTIRSLVTGLVSALAAVCLERLFSLAKNEGVASTVLLVKGALLSCFLAEEVEGG